MPGLNANLWKQSTNNPLVLIDVRQKARISPGGLSIAAQYETVGASNPSKLPTDAAVVAWSKEITAGWTVLGLDVAFGCAPLPAVPNYSGSDCWRGANRSKKPEMTGTA